MIYTASFFESKYWGTGRLVNIAKSCPRDFPPEEIEDKVFYSEILYPSWTLLNDYKNNMITEDKYKEIFLNELSKKLNITVEELYSGVLSSKILDLFGLCDEDTLLCWEPWKLKKFDKVIFCHRHIIAKILTNNLLNVNNH